MAVTGAEAQIVEALLWHVGQLVTTPATEFAMPDVRYNDHGVPYLKVEVLPNMADLEALPFDSPVIRAGLIQVSVFWPAGQGIVKPMQVASQAVQHFAPGTRIARNGQVVRIEEHPRVAPPVQESDWVQVPVTVRWRA